VQVEIPVVTPIPRLAVLAVPSDAAKVANNNRFDTAFYTLLYDCFREGVQEVRPTIRSLAVKTSGLTGGRIVALGFLLREVVFVLFECVTWIQHGFPAERDGGEVAYPEVNTGHLVTRRFRVDSGATDELQSPLVAFVDGANLLNVPLSQVNIRARLVLAQDEVRPVFFEVTAFRETDTGELCVVLEASRFERHS